MYNWSNNIKLLLCIHRSIPDSCVPVTNFHSTVDEILTIWLRGLLNEFLVDRYISMLTFFIIYTNVVLMDLDIWDAVRDLCSSLLHEHVLYLFKCKFNLLCSFATRNLSRCIFTKDLKSLFGALSKQL